MKARALVFVAGAFIALASPRDARAADDPAAQAQQRTGTFRWQTDKGSERLKVAFDAKDLVDGSVVAKLNSGVSTVIATRAYLFRDGEADPVALAVRTCQVARDLWEDGTTYRVKLSMGGATRDLAALSVDRIIKLCIDGIEQDGTGAEQPTLVLAERTTLTRGKAHFVGVIMEVNPVDDEQKKQLRRWVSRPAGSTGISPGDALFGSFVSFFAREIGKADRTLRFRTQLVTP